MSCLSAPTSSENFRFCAKDYRGRRDSSPQNTPGRRVDHERNMGQKLIRRPKRNCRSSICSRARLVTPVICAKAAFPSSPLGLSK